MENIWDNLPPRLAAALGEEAADTLGTLNHRHAACYAPLCGLPGLHPVRSRTLAEHIHLEPERISKSTYTHRKPTYGVVSFGLVLPHGRDRCVFPTRHNGPSTLTLCSHRHHLDHTRRKRRPARDGSGAKSSPNRLTHTESPSPCSQESDPDNRHWRNLPFA